MEGLGSRSFCFPADPGILGTPRGREENSWTIQPCPHSSHAQIPKSTWTPNPQIPPDPKSQNPDPKSPNLPRPQIPKCQNPDPKSVQTPNPQNPPRPQIFVSSLRNFREHLGIPIPWQILIPKGLSLEREIGIWVSLNSHRRQFPLWSQISSFPRGIKPKMENNFHGIFQFPKGIKPQMEKKPQMENNSHGKEFPLWS